MPRLCKGPRLWLRPAQNRGDRVCQAVWLIRDRRKVVSTGCGEGDRLRAEVILHEYKRRSGSTSNASSDPAKAPKRFFVYFLTAAFPGFPVKIGITSDVMGRHLALQTALPYEIEMLGYWPVDDPAAERAVHERFQHLWLRGEWFVRAQELISFISSLKLASRSPILSADRKERLGHEMDSA